MSGDSNIGGYETKVLLYIRKAMAGESQGALSEIGAARSARDRALADLEAAEARLADAEATLNGAGGRIAEIDAELASRGIDAEKLVLIDRQMDEVLGAYIVTPEAGSPRDESPAAPESGAEDDDGEGQAADGDESEIESEADPDASALRSADLGWGAGDEPETDDAGVDGPDAGPEVQASADQDEGAPRDAAAELPGTAGGDDSDHSLIQAQLAARRRPISIDPGQASLEEKVPTRGEARDNRAAFLGRTGKSDLPENVTRQVMDADEIRREMPSRRAEPADSEDHWGSTRSLAGRRGGNGDI